MRPEDWNGVVGRICTEPRCGTVLTYHDWQGSVRAIKDLTEEEHERQGLRDYLYILKHFY
jgi:hypothetical protein